MKRCMYCGHENEDANETCVKCGNQLMETPAPEQVPSQGTQAQPGEDTEGGAEEQIPDIQMPEEFTSDAPGYPQGDDAPVNPNLFGQDADPYGQNTDSYGQGAAPYGQGADPYGQGASGYEQGGTYYGQDQGAAYYGQNPADQGQQVYGGQNYGYPDGQGMYGQPEYDYPQDRPQGGSASPVLMKKARRRIRNPIGFLAILFFTVSVVASILNVALGNALTNISTVSHTITKMTGTNVAVNFMNSIVQMINGINRWYLMGAGLAACIPSVLLVFALWMIYGATTNKKAEISTAGYTMAKAAIIIKFIGVSVVLLAAVVFAVAFVVTAGASSSMMSLIAGVVVLLVMILITVFAIMYYIQVLYAIKVIKANVKSGRDVGRIPGFAVFIGFVGCACTVLTMLPMAPDDYIGLAAHGTYAAWLLLISLWAIIYKATVKTKR